MTSTSRVLSLEQEQEIVALYEQGLSLRNIAKRYEIVHCTVIGALARHGIQVRENSQHKRFTPEQIRGICEDYAQGMSVTDIAQKYEVPYRTTIYRALQRNGVILKGTKALTETEELNLVEQYKNGEINTRLSKKFGVTKVTSKSILKRHNIEIRPGKRAKYRLNPHVFDDLDDEVAAWCLGFIYADGNVSNNALRIGIQGRDIYILNTIKDFCQSNALIYYRIHNGFADRGGNKNLCEIVTLQLTNEYMATRLKELGILPKRQHFDQTLAELPESQYNHFIRGFLDGDGSISKRVQCPMVRFWDHPDILLWIRETLHNKVGASDKVNLISKPGIYELSWSGRQQCSRILDYLYKDATVWLPRKREAAAAWWIQKEKEQT